MAHDAPGQEMAESTLQKRIGERLRRVRKSKGLSLEDMVRLGFNAGHLSRIEHGDYNIRIKTLASLAAALDIRPSELLDE